MTALLVVLLAGMFLSKAHLGIVGRALARAAGYGYGYGYGTGGYDSACGRLTGVNKQTVDGNPLKICVYKSGLTEARYDTTQVASLIDGWFSLESSAVGGARWIELVPAGQDAPVTTGADTTQTTHFTATAWTSTGRLVLGTVDQTVRYHAGDQAFRLDYRFTNTSAQAQALVARINGFIPIGDGTATQGSYTAGPPQKLIASDATENSQSGIVAVTPFDHYALKDRYTSTTDDTALLTPGGYAPFATVEWDNRQTTPVAAGQSVTWSMQWRLKQTRGMRAFPFSQFLNSGDTSTTTLRYFDPSKDVAGKTVQWETTDGQTGTATTDSAGEATVSFTAPDGRDWLHAFVDLNGNAIQDPGEHDAWAFRYFGTGRTDPGTTPPAPAPQQPPTGGTAPSSTGPAPVTTRTPAAQLANTAPAASLPALAPVTIRAPRLALLAKRGLQVGTVAPRAGRYRWALLLDRATAHRARIAAAKPVTVATASAQAKKAGAKVSATLRLKGKAARGIKRLRKVTFVLQTTFTGADGKVQVATSKVTVKR